LVWIDVLSKIGWTIPGAVALMLAAGPGVGEPKAVLELFTSQGCSSCPPADKLVGEYAKRDDVLALTFNVDYWDYLGWKDTLGSREHSDRQRAYAAARGDGQVYTPQIIVNGADHVVGSNRSAVEAAIKRDGPLPVSISLEEKDDAITLTVDKNGTKIDHAALWLAIYRSEVTVPIERGENSGETITYSNVVRKLRPIAMWDGDAMSVDLPKSEVTKAKAKRCAVILQAENDAGQPGRILGAATINLHSPDLGPVSGGRLGK
jgi:hypothetical protein